MVAFVKYACKKMFAQHPMVPLLAIWLHLLIWLPPKKMVARPPMVAQHPMVPLLAIWLRLSTRLTTKKMVARPPMVALKTDEIQTIN
jgi:hypothetical protein